jgi:hypothetical protein
VYHGEKRAEESVDGRREGAVEELGQEEKRG